MNGTGTALLVMGVAAVTMTSAVVGFKAAAAPSVIQARMDITLQRRIDKAGASVAITSDGAAAFSPNGDIIAINSDANEVPIAFGCQCASERARAVAVSADGSVLVIGVPDANEVVVMRRKRQGNTWFEHQIIKGPTGFGNKVQLSPDGNRCFVASYETWAVHALIGDLYSQTIEGQASAAASNRHVTWVGAAGGGRLDVVQVSCGTSRWTANGIDSERVMTVAVNDDGSTAFIAYTAADVLVLTQSGQSARQIDTIKNTIDGFGRAIVITGNLCFIGSPYEDRVYVYSFDHTRATLLIPIVPDEGGLGSEFGAQLTVTDTHMAVLAPGYGTDERGAVFVFKFSEAVSRADH